jgi:hypothetical protein
MGWLGPSRWTVTDIRAHHVGEEDVFVFFAAHVGYSMLPQCVHPGSRKAYHTAFFGGVYEQLIQIAHDKHREPNAGQRAVVQNVFLRIASSSDLVRRIYVEGDKSWYIFLSPIEHGGPCVEQTFQTKGVEKDMRP